MSRFHCHNRAGACLLSCLLALLVQPALPFRSLAGESENRSVGEDPPKCEEALDPKKQDVAELIKVIEAWKAWRAKQPPEFARRWKAVDLDANPNYECEKGEDRLLSKRNFALLDEKQVETLLRGDFSGACFRKSNFTRSDGERLSLQWAIIEGANFFKACMDKVSVGCEGSKPGDEQNPCSEASGIKNARNVIFEAASLKGADFDRADLSNSSFSRAHMEGAYLGDADLYNACFDPHGEPLLQNLHKAHNLSNMRWCVDPTPLRNLEERLNKAGFAKSAREVRYARKQSQLNDEGWTLSAIAQTVFLKWSGGWGDNPGRPFLIAAISSLLLSGLAYLANNAEQFKLFGAVFRQLGAVEQQVIPQHAIGTEKPRAERVSMKSLGIYLWYPIAVAFPFNLDKFAVGRAIFYLDREERSFVSLGWMRTAAAIHAIICTYALGVILVFYFIPIVGANAP